MTVAPLLRGLLGVEVTDLGRTVRFAPQLPADWTSVEVRHVAAGAGALDFALSRRRGQMSIKVRSRGDLAGHAHNPTAVVFAPAFPLDANVRSVKADGRALKYRVEQEGDVQRVEFRVEAVGETEVVIAYDEGTDVYLPFEPPAPGARSESLRVLRSRAEAGALHLLLEGRGGRTYTLHLKTPHAVGEAAGITATRDGADDYRLNVSFDTSTQDYVWREVVIPLKKR
jgi:hypothetical protein